MAKVAKTPPHKFYTTEEVAEMLRLHTQTVRNLLLEKRMGGIKIGLEWRISEEDLTEFIKENRNK
jgi:excisionase family DNA binding protein